MQKQNVKKATGAVIGAGLILETSAGQWQVGTIINATGTWNNPLLPKYPGSETFTGG